MAARQKKRGEADHFGFQNESQVLDLLATCYKHDLNWLQFSYVESGELTVAANGKGGFGQIASLIDDNSLFYFLIGLQLEDEGDYTQTKWMLLSWVGPEVTPVQKARSSQHRVLLFDFINPHLRLAGEYQALHSSDLTEELLIHKLTLSKVGEKSEEELLRAAALDAKKKEKREGTGLAKSSLKSEAENPFFTPDEAKEAIQDVQDKSTETTWALFGYGPDSDRPIFLKKGTGGCASFAPLFNAEELSFVLHGIVSDEGEYGLRKIALISWVGSGASPSNRVRSSVHRNQIYQYSNSIGPVHGEYQTFAIEEVTDDLLKRKLVGTNLLDKSQAASSAAHHRLFDEGSRSRNLEFVDKDAVANAVKSLISDSGSDWAVLGYDKNDKIHIAHEGSGSVKDFKQFLASDSLNYIFMGTAVAEGAYSVQKNVLVSWVGLDVPPIYRSISAQHRVQLYDFGNTLVQMHGELQALHPDDLSDELLQQKLAGSRYVSAADEEELSAAHRGRGQAGKIEKFQFVDEASVRADVGAIRAGKLNWLYFEHTDEGSLDVLHKGTGQYGEVESHFDDTKVSYVLLGINLEDEGDYTQTKLVLVTWVGVKVDPLHKARSSQARVLLYDFIKTMVTLAGEFQALERSEISLKKICDKIAQTTVGQKSEEELLRAAAEDALKKEKREGTGLHKTVENKAAPNPFTNPDEGHEAIMDFGNPKSDTNWALFGYKDKSNDLYFLKKGTGQLDQFMDNLRDDVLAYVLYGVHDSAEGEYGTLKYMMIAWVGVKVKPLHRARSAHHRVAIYQYASEQIPMHGELQVMTPEDLSEENLRKKLIGSNILEEGDGKGGISIVVGRAEGASIKDSAIRWSDEEAAKKAILSLRSKEDLTDFVVFGYTDNLKFFSVLEVGTGGVKNCRHHFKNNSCVFVVLSAVVADGEYSVQKNILISWVGPDVLPLQRSRSSQNRVQLYQYATELIQLHGEIQALSEAEISDDLVAQKLSGSKYDVAADESEGLAAHKTRSKRGQAITFTMEDEASFAKCIEEFRSRSLNWVILGYRSPESSTLAVLETGKGGYSELEPFFKDDALIYFLFGVQTEDEGEYTQTKNILVTWIGKDLDPLRKALSSQHRVTLYQRTKKIVQLHGELQVLNRGEISEQIIIEKLTLSKEREEDSLVAARLLDEEKLKQREEKQRQSSSAAKYQFVSTTKDPSPFVDSEEDNAKKAILDVADDLTTTNYIVFEYAANKSNMVVSKTGTGDVDSFKSFFANDNIVYVLYGKIFADGDYSVVKRVLLTWVGPKTKPLHKARSSQHRAALYKHINAIAMLTGEFHALEGLDSINDELIQKKLEGTKILEQQDKEKAKKAVADRSNLKRGASFNFRWEDTDELEKACKSIASGDITWVKFGTKPNAGSFSVLDSGKGDVDAIHGLLSPTEIFYFVLAKECPDQSLAGGRDASNYNVIRYLFINWIGPKVKPMLKARSSQTRNSVYDSVKKLVQLHGEIQVSSTDELTDDVVFDKLGVTGWRVS